MRTEREAPRSRRVLSDPARLLLCSADPSPPAGVEIDVRPGEVDWEALLRIALRERAAGPLWGYLHRTDLRLPEDFARRLKRAAAFERLRQMQLAERLEESVAALDEVGVTQILLKGAALILTCYADVTERPMGDIDLLVPPDQGAVARDALTGAGWRHDPRRYPEAHYDRHFHLPPLEDENRSGIELEIHTALLLPGHPFDLGPRRLRAGARPVTVGEATVLVPDPRDHLLYLCAHFAWGHALGRGGWRAFRDVAALSRTDAFEWQDVLESVRSARASPSAYWTLRLARELACIRVPAFVLEELRPAIPEAVLERLASHYALELLPEGQGCPSVRLRRALWIAGNEWAYGERTSTPPGDTARPWKLSGEFDSHLEGRASPERGVAKIRRHLRESQRWRSYLRRIVL